jgi:putative transposase
MARLPRTKAAGYPHHVIQRGNNRQQVFVDAHDYERYLSLLHETAAAHSVAVHAYVLMTNHVHLLVTPDTEAGLSRFMQALGRRYVRAFNDRHRRTGTLWEGRFRSTVVASDRYFLACMRYIELNPVRAGLATEPAEYRWSSHPHHIGHSVDPRITDHALFWALGNTPFERQSAYQQLFESTLSEQELANIRRYTNRGWALTSGSQLGPPNMPRGPDFATPRPRGRPRRQTPR